LLDNTLPPQEKRITAEVCVQNLLFCDEDYDRLGARIKWNPSIKTSADREQLWEALLDGRIDFITTDHAPHTSEEKSGTYVQALSGAPMIQHALPVMLDFVNEGKLSLTTLVEKMSHNPAIVYNIKDRGFIREGYYADLTLVDLNDPWIVDKDNVYYKCGWSPLEGRELRARVIKTWVNGSLVFDEVALEEEVNSRPLETMLTSMPN
jgi:dihydroorotase